MKGRMKKTVWVLLLGSSLLFFMIACSTMKNILGWPEYLVSEETKVAHFFSNVRPHQGNPVSHYLLACYYQELGSHKEALEEFRKVLLFDPNYLKAYNGMGVSYDLMGDFPRAIESYKKALEINPDLDYVHNNLGYSYLLQGNLDDAITAFKKAIALNHEDKRFHNNLGLAYAENSQFDFALAEFKLGGDEAKAYHNMAQLYFKKGLFDEAKSYYAMALTINPSLTIVRTGFEAAIALARIFLPIHTSEPKKLVMPDQLSVRIAEIEKMVASNQSPTVNSEAEKEVINNQSNNENSGAIPLTNIEQPPMAIVKEEQMVSVDQKAEIKQLSSLKDAGIEISNGNGVNRMAKKVGDYLKEKGLKVTRLTNANNFNHTETKIVYQKKYDEAADHVAGQLPISRSKEETEKFDRPNIKIKIVIGKDLIPHYKTFENGKNS